MDAFKLHKKPNQEKPHNINKGKNWKEMVVCKVMNGISRV